MDPLPSSWLDRLRSTLTRPERTLMVRTAPLPWQGVLQALVDGPEPDQALVRAQGLPAELWQAPFSPRLARLLHEGSYAARLVGLDPTARHGLDPDAPRLAPIQALRQQLTARTLDEALGIVRTHEYLRLAAREVEDAPLEEVGGDLCTLVSACLQVVLEQLSLADQVVVFGMGKLGGDELNFLSDIDLVFVHDDAVGDSVSSRGATVDLHNRLRQLVRHLEGQGRWRPVFRVDLRLRPFGRRGPLSTSVSATEAYYERHGRPWERQVWLRARPLAGRFDLGQLLLARLTPFVYRRSVGPEIFAEIADMMQRARREATRIGAEAVDLKLDAGGIREIEFTVQALQLLHGGRNPSVRSTGTLPALDSLLAAGLVSDREHRDLSRAYRWLRRVEHRVQLTDGQQTHRLPAEPSARARLLGRLRWPKTDATESLDEQLEQHRARTRAIAQTIAGDDPPNDPRTRDMAVVLDEGAPRPARITALRSLGVYDPTETEALLEHLYTRPNGAFTARGDARQGADNLLRACLDSADPVAATSRLVELCAARPAHYGLWRAFARPGPAGLDLLRLTGEVLGASEPLSRGLIGFPPGRPAGTGHPATPPDPILGLLQRAAQPTLPTTATLTADLRQLPPDPRGLDATLLHFKHQQLVRVGLHDLGRRPDPMAVGRSISDIADLVVRMLLRDLAAEPGPAFDLSVLALGKHGMRAMDYGSDLDLMFVFDPRPDDHDARAQARATRLAQQLMSRLESRVLGLRLYEVDMRLRPSGRQGLLVTSLAGFGRYHQRTVAVWERLALLRMRPVAEIRTGEPGQVGPVLHGSPRDIPGQYMATTLPGPLSQTVQQTVDGTLGFGPASGPHADASQIRSQTRRLRDRIERELGRENRTAGWYNAKTGQGGCLELELLVAALQLIHGPTTPAARALGIIDALEGLGASDHLSLEEVTALSADYRFSRLLLNRLRMSPGRRGDDPDRFSENSPRLVTLARRMGLPGRTELMERFFHARARIRAAFDRHLPG
ncbi:MAG: hypothetical protein AAGF11_43775 [Myxococcota bacterium]